MRLAIAVFSVLLLAGCGSDSNPEESSETPPATDRHVSLKELCPEVEAMVVANEDDPSANTADLAEPLEDLTEEADQEAANALRLLVEAARDSDTSGLASDDALGVIEAQQAFIDGLDAFAGRCKTAGSSALQ